MTSKESVTDLLNIPQWDLAVFHSSQVFLLTGNNKRLLLGSPSSFLFTNVKLMARKTERVVMFFAENALASSKISNTM